MIELTLFIPNKPDENHPIIINPNHIVSANYNNDAIVEILVTGGLVFLVKEKLSYIKAHLCDGLDKR